MLKRIHGIAIFFYQLRISKVLAPVIVVALILLLFMSRSIRVHAQAINASLQIGSASPSTAIFDLTQGEPISYTVSGSTRYYRDVYLSIRQNYQIADFDPDNAYFGYLSSLYNVVLELGYNQTNNTMLKIEFIDDQINPDRFGIGPGSMSITNSNHNISLSNIRNYRFWNNDAYESAETGTLYYHYRIHYVSDNMLNEFRIKSSGYAAGSNYIRYCRKSELSLVDINQYCYEMSGLLNDLYLESVGIGSTQALILYEIRNLSNGFNSDTSGVSDTLDNIHDNYNSAQATVDAVVDDAIHDYDTELSAVEDMDFSSFFNTQRYALNFWRSVGEYILDSDNIGYIATGLIVVTVINLFVFLLRL